MVGLKRYEMNWNGRRLVLGERTLIMGILNVTPDSFSDGGLFAQEDVAVEHGERMVLAGADIIDVGGESTRPFADPVSEEEELRRVVPVIQRLSEKVDVPISIDTTRAKVAQKALEAGASIVNDISAMEKDPEIASVVADFGVPVILMHMKGTPKTMQLGPQYDDVVDQVKDYLAGAVDRAVEHGISRKQVLIDPGIGFGKTVRHNLLLISNLSNFFSLDVPVLLGPSRKSFIKKTLVRNGIPKEGEPSAEQVELATQAVLAASARTGVHVVRVHDVETAKQTVLLADAIRRGNETPGTPEKIE